MKKSFILITVLVLIGSFFVFFNGTEKEGAAPAEKEMAADINQWEWTTDKGTFKLSERIAKKVANGEKLIFRASVFSPGSPLFVPIEKGMLDKAAEYGNIDMKMIGPADAVVEKQVAELETLISAEKVDGLAIGTYDVGSTMPMFKKAWDAGIPVISWDLDSPDAYRLSYVGIPTLHEMGLKGGNAFLKFHPEKTGKLAFFAAFPEAPYARENIKGFLDPLMENGYQMEMIGPFKLSLDKSFGYGVAENAFLANPDITGVYVADEYCVVVAQYLERNNLQDDVVLIGKNDMQDILQYVKKGVIKHTITTKPYEQGQNIVKVLYEFLTEGKTVGYRYSIELGDITAENVDDYLE